MERWKRERNIVILLLLMAIFLGFLIGHFLLLLLLIVLALLVRQTIKINQLERWLNGGAFGDTPDAKGIWEDIYFHLYKIKKNEKRRKKKLSKMIDQFRKSTNALPDAAVVLGRYGEIEWTNRAARNVLGLKKSDKGQRIPNLIRSPQFIQYLGSNDYDKKISLVSPVNEEIILQITIVPYGAGLRLLLAQDITQLKKMEQMRKDFVANVSHELRTPLTVLKGYLETLQDMDEYEQSMYFRSFQQMFAQTERMQILVDDLLMLTRLETKERHSECVNVVDLLTLICHDGEFMKLSKRRLELIFETDIKIQGDPHELRSAFTNLMVNALKYSPDDSVVKIRWKAKDNEVRLEVEDQGEGIAENEIPRITERFYRVDLNRSKKISGTGLGLSIVKHVLLRHDAKLEIRSRMDEGSCFCCVFPKQRIC